MCTLIILYKQFEEYPIVALHNRYAIEGTYEYPPVRTKLILKTVHPVDLSGGGTWIGFNEAKVFGAVTDQHTDITTTFWKSRGRLLLNALGCCKSAVEAKDYVKNELLNGGYKKGNFIILDDKSGYHILFDDKIYEYELGPGKYVFTNLMLHDKIVLTEHVKDVLSRVEKRRDRAEELIQKINLNNIDLLIKDLMMISRDHKFGLSEYSICYHGNETWYMSSATIVAVSNDLSSSKILYCRGNPCRNKFIDYSYLLSNSSEITLKDTRLINKKIAVCLTGSVACIESPKLIRELRRHGAEVHCYMTENAIKYGVSEHVVEWASRNPVVTELTGKAEHLIDFDLVIVYPATANTISKYAYGIADNAVTTLLASTQPNKVMISPTMNLKLYNNPIVQENISKLKEMGVVFLEPRVEEGALKISDIEYTVDLAIRKLSVSKLRDRGVLILAGPTRYDIDAIRYISNKSTGRLGYYLAKEAFYRGCIVDVIYGPGIVSFPKHINVINVYSTEDFLHETLNKLSTDKYDVIIFSAAILDFKPEKYIDTKIKSGSELEIKLVPTPKVIGEVRAKFPEIFTVSFKLEYNVSKSLLIERAREEMEKYNVNMVVANDLKKISNEHHEAIIISRDGKIFEYKGSKSGLAKEIFDVIESSI